MVHLAIRIVFLFHCIVFFAHCIAYKKTHWKCKSKITKLDVFTFALSVRFINVALPQGAALAMELADFQPALFDLITTMVYATFVDAVKHKIGE